MTTIITKLTQEDFINVNFVLWFKKRSIKILIGIYHFFLLSSLISLASSTTGVFQVVFPLLFMTAVPVLIYFSAKRNYGSNKRVSEAIEYKFDKDALIVTGESLNSQLSWDKIYKVTQTRNWLLIWQNAQVANVIPKRDVWQSHLDDLKDILNTYNVKHNL